VGALLTGVFAEKALNGAFDGALFGNPAQILAQGAAVLGAMFYSGAGTFVVLKLIGLVMPLRATAAEEAEGLDITTHGEDAYAQIGGSSPAEEAAKGAAHPVLKPARADV
jgi:Amt family ammonium transporter